MQNRTLPPLITYSSVHSFFSPPSTSFPFSLPSFLVFLFFFSTPPPFIFSFSVSFLRILFNVSLSPPLRLLLLVVPSFYTFPLFTPLCSFPLVSFSLRSLGLVFPLLFLSVALTQC